MACEATVVTENKAELTPNSFLGEYSCVIRREAGEAVSLLSFVCNFLVKISFQAWFVGKKTWNS